MVPFDKEICRLIEKWLWGILKVARLSTDTSGHFCRERAVDAESGTSQKTIFLPFVGSKSHLKSPTTPRTRREVWKQRAGAERCQVRVPPSSPTVPAPAGAARATGEGRHSFRFALGASEGGASRDTGGTALPATPAPPLWYSPEGAR